MIPTITHQTLTTGFRQLGLHAGMGLMVHSSLKSLGYVEGGAHTVIAALMNVITSEGTLLMPSFNHGAPFEAGGPGYFDPLSTPTTNGAIPDAFWRLPGVSRSLDPTHAVAAWGKNARRYTQSHHRTLTMGIDSPLGLLLQDDGWCLLLGVGYWANTFHHVVEMSTGAPCLGLRTEAYPVQLPDGRRVPGRTWGWRNGNCPFTDDGRYPFDLQQRGLHKEIQLGLGRLILYRLSDGYAVINNLLRYGRDGIPGCTNCPIRPRQCDFTVPSDWDSTNHRPLPNSISWTY